ncbi:MAG: CC0125/CC1285 family lipoprotein [Geminicoccaceae bacterium]
MAIGNGIESTGPSYRSHEVLTFGCGIARGVGRSAARPREGLCRANEGWNIASPVLHALALASVLLLAGCASSPTPYQAAHDGYGYGEQQIEENRYRVSFAGNAATSRQTVEDYLLYRAAELTVQHGHDYFEVADRNTEQAFGGGYGSPQVGVGMGGGSGLGVGLSVPVFGGGGGSSRYTAHMDVLMLDGEKPADDPNAYDALSVISRLQPKALTGGR